MFDEAHAGSPRDARTIGTPARIGLAVAAAIAALIGAAVVVMVGSASGAIVLVLVAAMFALVASGGRMPTSVKLATGGVVFDGAPGDTTVVELADGRGRIERAFGQAILDRRVVTELSSLLDAGTVTYPHSAVVRVGSGFPAAFVVVAFTGGGRFDPLATLNCVRRRIEPFLRERVPCLVVVDEKPSVALRQEIATMFGATVVTWSQHALRYELLTWILDVFPRGEEAAGAFA